MFSIVIAAKDAERWIQQTIDSVLTQTFENWECIISVNGSSDKTIEIVQGLSDKRFSVIESQIPNKSLAVNRAISKAKYDWISILDADDLWNNNKLASQYAFLTTSKVDVLGTQMIYVDENNMSKSGAPTLPTAHEDCVSWLNSHNNPIANSSVVYRKMIHDMIGYYNPEMFAVEDYDMWMRAKRAGLIFGNTNDLHLRHRLHTNSNYNSSNKQQIMKYLVDEIDIFQKNFSKC